MKNKHSLILQGLLAAAVIGLAVPMPDLALAADDLVGLSSNATTQLKALPGVISAVSYVGGAVLGVKGIMMLRAHAEQPQPNGIGKAVGTLAGGGALLALPYMTKVLQGATGSTGNSAATYNAISMGQ